MAAPVRRSCRRPLRAAMAVLALLVLRAGAAAETAPAAAQPTVPTEADFEFVGAFGMPTSYFDNSWGVGLTLRYVEGKPHFLATSFTQTSFPVYEVAFPGMSLKPPYPQAPIVQRWGDIYHGKRRSQDPAAGNGYFGWVKNLYWDEADQRLYWIYGSNEGASDHDPSIGYSTLNDADGTSTAYGPWALAGWGSRMAMGGITAIPTWFADRYCAGKRLGLGFGGASAGGQGSMGPALAAFAPPDPAAPPSSDLAAVPLVDYPFTDKRGEIDRCHRDTDYTAFDAWYPKGGIGYWNVTDIIGSAVWIDLPDKSGFLAFATMGKGLCRNIRGGGISCEREALMWYVYDPQDLAAVATGAKQPWQIQPAGSWNAHYPGIPAMIDLAKSPGGFTWHVVGATFDARTRLLYVAVRWAYQDGNGGGSHLVYVYHVKEAAADAKAQDQQQVLDAHPR